VKSVGGAGLVVVGFLFLYLAITGRLDCFFTFVSCVTGASNPTGTTSNTGSGDGINWAGLVNTGIDIFGNSNGGTNGGMGTGTRTPTVIAAPTPLFH
jgi:hypothetical protein